MTYRLIKRLLDLILALICLILFSPFAIPIMIILRFSAEGEIFYYQERVGYKKENFKIWKFATMLKNSLEIGTGSITLKNDYRVTKPGRILRKTKVNEIPQLVNIIKGDISVVGPRPVLLSDFLLYPKNIQNLIYNVKPGLTGIGSIIFRDEEEILSNIGDKDPHVFFKKFIVPYKGSLEIWYQNNQSFSTDLKLIILTFWVIIFPTSTIYNKWFKNLPKRNF